MQTLPAVLWRNRAPRHCIIVQYSIFQRCSHYLPQSRDQMKLVLINTRTIVCFNRSMCRLCHRKSGAPTRKTSSATLTRTGSFTRSLLREVPMFPGSTVVHFNDHRGSWRLLEAQVWCSKCADPGCARDEESWDLWRRSSRASRHARGPGWCGCSVSLENSSWSFTNWRFISSPCFDITQVFQTSAVGSTGPVCRIETPDTTDCDHCVVMWVVWLLCSR